MARVAKSKAEDLEAVQTAQEAAQDTLEAAGSTDTTTAAEGARMPPRTRKPPRTRRRKRSRKSWCMWGRSFPVGG